MKSIAESTQWIKDTVSGKERPAQGTRFVYAPLILITIAFALSVLALCSCEFVIYNDPECEANPCTRTSGIYCYDSSLREKIQNFFIGTIQKFVQVIGTGTAVLGFIATLLLWKAIKKAHGRCMFKVLGLCAICCVPGQFITLSMLQSDFCWDLSKARNFCSLGWGGNVSIASACIYFVGCIALCKVPQPIEREEAMEEEHADVNDPDKVETGGDAAVGQGDTSAGGASTPPPSKDEKKKWEVWKK